MNFRSAAVTLTLLALALKALHVTAAESFDLAERKERLPWIWQTILHLMGVDHTRLTFRFGGRDIRLTDVHGNVIHRILA